MFVVGSPRSGTTLLYHMLLSAGDFAVYRAEARVFDLLAPCFGDLHSRRNRVRLLEAWLPSRLFRRSGLEAAAIRERILHDCRSAGDFLRILMDSIAEKQKVRRWAECTPLNLLYLSEIKRSFPQALFLHIVRDGRDVALSLEKQGWIRPFPWDRERSVLVAGLYWEWLVREGRENAHPLAPDYLEVHFEALVSRPQETLAKISAFIEHDLDYRRIQQVAIGSVRQPNTSFQSDTPAAKFEPVRRWEEAFPREALQEFEGVLGPFLQELGYVLATRDQSRARRERNTMRALYRRWYSGRHWLKSKTPLGRLFVNTDWLRAPDPAPPDQDLAAKVAVD